MYKYQTVSCTCIWYFSTISSPYHSRAPSSRWKGDFRSLVAEMEATIPEFPPVAEGKVFGLEHCCEDVWALLSLHNPLVCLGITEIAQPPGFEDDFIVPSLEFSDVPEFMPTREPKSCPFPLQGLSPSLSQCSCLSSCLSLKTRKLFLGLCFSLQGGFLCQALPLCQTHYGCGSLNETYLSSLIMLLDYWCMDFAEKLYEVSVKSVTDTSSSFYMFYVSSILCFFLGVFYLLVCFHVVYLVCVWSCFQRVLRSPHLFIYMFRHHCK